MVSVLFVCLGNICRSPTAHAVFERLLEREGLAGEISVDSCGTGAWHVGEPPDSRAAAAARFRGYEMDHLRARQVRQEDFGDFDYVLAMDRDNLDVLHRMCPRSYRDRVGLFLSYGAGLDEDEVPDPYYGGASGFDHVLDLVENAANGLLAHIREHRLA